MNLFDQLDYVGPIYRPPSEARSVLLQATVGCSHGKCTFCSGYAEKRFALKPRAVVERDLSRAAGLFRGARRLFVTDGDAMVMPMEQWRWLLPTIGERLPWIERVGTYATGRSVRNKSDAELRWLREQGLGIVYLGVESGDGQTLAYVRKDSTAEELVTAGRRLKAAGLALSVTVLVGIAPPGRSRAHAEETGRVLSAMDPDYAGALSVVVCEGTELASQVESGTHVLPGPREYLLELRTMLAATEMTGGYFMANHASNYLPLRVRMPHEKPEALALLGAAAAGEVPLRPEHYRAL